MQRWSTYCVHSMDDKANRAGLPWEIGTLRVNVYGDTWYVSTPLDRWWGTAYGSWYNDGEYFDGNQWVRINTTRNGAELRRLINGKT